MMRTLFIFFICLISSSVFALPLACLQALPTTHPGFCASFKSVAQCHCEEKIPGALCKDMKTLYKRMLDMFGSLQKACEYQKDTTTQICIDDWNCYLNGGRNSQGGLCSNTGAKCE